MNRVEGCWCVFCWESGCGGGYDVMGEGGEDKTLCVCVRERESESLRYNGEWTLCTSSTSGEATWAQFVCRAVNVALRRNTLYELLTWWIACRCPERWSQNSYARPPTIHHHHIHRHAEVLACTSDFQDDLVPAKPCPTCHPPPESTGVSK